MAGDRVKEAPHPRLPAGPLFSELFRNVKAIVWSRAALYGAIYFLSPVGAGALGNLISSVGPDYHSSGTLVALVTGAAGGALMGLGSMAGGKVCDRVNRMHAYAAFGLLEALAACWLWWAPHTPFTYGAGYLAYAFTTGLAYTAYSALILDVIGKARRGAAVGYAVFSSCGNVPVIYMTGSMAWDTNRRARAG